ncbi:MAG: tetratricopeptide repeat protein [Ignavibacteriaceae bacterium]
MSDLLVEKSSQFIEKAKQAYEKNDYLTVCDCLELLIKFDSSKPQYFSSLATAQKKLNKFEEAEINYLNALKIQPLFWEASYNLGLLLQEKGKLNEAIKYYKVAIESNPNLHIAYYNLGNAYREMEKFSDAILYYLMAIDAKKDFSDAYYNLGVVYEHLFDFENALQIYEYALKYEPNHIYAHWNKSLLLLLKGDYKNGFEEFEWRILREKSVKRNFFKPKLTNLKIAGKKVYVYCEQGLGDTIQFVRFLSDLKKLGCYLIFEVDPLLVILFSNLNFIDKLVPRLSLDEPIVDYDYQISLLSLPKLFRTTVEKIPSYTPYLQTDKNKVKHWNDKLAIEYLKVGIAWAGNPNHSSDKKRSVSLKCFEKIAGINSLKLFSLQIGEASKEINEVNFDIKDLSSFGMNDFSDTAAVIANLDLVITVDTAVVHLAGAIGKETWLLLPYFPDWRWMLDRKDSPWYPSIKLFRQPNPGDWDSVFQNVMDELKDMVRLTLED